MAIDVDRFQQVTPLLQQLWSSPLQVVISLFLLYQTIGWAVAGGVFVMVALIPCNLVVVRITRRWQVVDLKFGVANFVISFFYSSDGANGLQRSAPAYDQRSLACLLIAFNQKMTYNPIQSK
jgi:hypothetical protein